MLSRLFIAPIRAYQRYLSPLKMRPTCRFAPTCSCYAIEAIERRGVVVGLAKTLWRLLRCNPFCRGGYDPVDRAHRELPPEPSGTSGMHPALAGKEE
ncbi:MAG TPA: membrane protein insertion efficiency factor YidD [Kofleriaceae bacterium]|nr:membrane protein insertion efficiency factor YidD [Kofleriaceae bacterium]